MTQKTVLITGCSSGIGLYCAQNLDPQKYQVLATARKADDVKKLTELGLTAHQLDLADQKSIETAFNWVLKSANSPLYALFNNAAYAQPGALEDLNTHDLRINFESNFFGWHHLTRLCLPQMLAANQGRIIQNSSVLGLVAMKFRGSYNATKFAIEGYTDTLRLELRGTGVKVCLIEPGPITSQFRANALQQFEANVDIATSRWQNEYQQLLAKLKQPGPAAPFTLGPEAVHQALLHALQSKAPKARYYVTKATWIMAILKRLSSSALLDRIAAKF